jgi:hypothetical protein
MTAATSVVVPSRDARKPADVVSGDRDQHGECREHDADPRVSEVRGEGAQKSEQRERPRAEGDVPVLTGKRPLALDADEQSQGEGQQERLRDFEHFGAPCEWIMLPRTLRSKGPA